MDRVAVVFGGGGIVGLAWELGVVEGLSEGGFDPAAARSIIGTSAGSIVGALLSSRVSMSELTVRGMALAPELMGLMQAVDRPSADEIFGIWRDAGMTPNQDDRARIGRLAMTAPTASEDAYVDLLGRLLALSYWPRGLIVTGVDAEDGAFATWTAQSGVPVARAVAASCALPAVFPPVTIEGRRYIDGGVRSPVSADLAAGCDLVVVIAPDASDAMRACLERDGVPVQASGGRIDAILPDAEGQAVIGPDYMDIGRVDDAFAAGVREGLIVGPMLAGQTIVRDTE
jgi:NTE family protein